MREEIQRNNLRSRRLVERSIKKSITLGSYHSLW